jgi:hypothetical protein
MFLAVGCAARVDPDLSHPTTVPVDPAGLTINGTYGQTINGQAFQEQVLVSFHGWQYATYYDAARHVCVARRKLPGTDWQIARLADYTFEGDDAHNTISMGICPNDGTIHLAFDHHGSRLHYRVSAKGVAVAPENFPFTAALFGPVTDTLEHPMDVVTYPAFVQTPEGNLQFFCRLGSSGNGADWMVDYTAGRWTGTRQIDAGTGNFTDADGTSPNRNAYPNGYTYGTDGRLHITWVWRESPSGANHDICYAYSDDRGKTWRNQAGTVINPGDGKTVITYASPGIIVVPIDRRRSLMNTQTQAVDSKGHLHVVMWHGMDGQTAVTPDACWFPTRSAYFHYWLDEHGTWQRSQLPGPVGTRPAMLFDRDDNAYVVYATNRDPAHWSHDLYFTDGQLTIAKATPGTGWTDWTVIHRGTGSCMCEPRPDRDSLHQDGVLSIFQQAAPAVPGNPSAVSVVDFAGRH